MFSNRKRNEQLKSKMMEEIMKEGAWFSTRKDNYLKIGYSAVDACLIARECVLKDGSLEGGAYTFGTDWFDINFHGRYIDIYIDPDTFRRWDVQYDPERGTLLESAEQGVGQGERVLKFCRLADREALAGNLDPYHIDSANFAQVIELSEDR